MAPGNLTISDSSRRRLSCYLDVGLHDTRIDNITSISDVEWSNVVVAPASFATNEYFFASKKIRIEKISRTSDNRVTPDISMIQQKTFLSKINPLPRYDIRLPFETYSSTRSSIVIFNYSLSWTELIIKYFIVFFFYRNTRRNVYLLSIIQKKRETGNNVIRNSVGALARDV